MQIKPSLTLVLLAATVVSCNHNSQKQSHPTQGSSDIHSISLPHYQSNLPPAPGREAFAAACLSCHTTRYITMQPPMTAAKWEENVRKMNKTYGALLTEDQVPQIVQYLMATKESGPAQTWESLAVETPAPALTVTLAMDTMTREKDLKQGQLLFSQNCAKCHGQSGAGDGIAAPTMLP